MRLFPMIAASIMLAGVGLDATAASAMNATEMAQYRKFEQQCRAAGGQLVKVKTDVYECKYPSGALKLCNYTGAAGYCFSSDVEVPQGVAEPRQDTRLHFH